ncbi:MAG: shikimate dehydrogenase [Desulfovibrio sp.]
MKKYGIIGHPLGHTMSPTLHNWGFATKSIQATYGPWPTTPEELPAFMERFRNEPIHGLSITIPHKEAVGEYADELTEAAKNAGAVNTLYRRGDKIIATNTDINGISDPVKARALDIQSALILGAGGAARAAVYAMKEMGVSHIYISNRTESRAQELADEFHINLTPWNDRANLSFDLLINSTPLGMSGNLEALNPWPEETILPANAYIFDLVYNPMETQLLKFAKRCGCKTISGLEMFIYQGLEQFRLWTGEELDAQKARELIEAKLNE